MFERSCFMHRSASVSPLSSGKRSRAVSLAPDMRSRVPENEHSQVKERRSACITRNIFGLQRNIEGESDDGNITLRKLLNLAILSAFRISEGKYKLNRLLTNEH